MKLIDTYKQIVKEDKGCPAATQDIDLNLKNRNKAFKEYNYGPADPRLDLKIDVDTNLDGEVDIELTNGSSGKPLSFMG